MAIGHTFSGVIVGNTDGMVFLSHTFSGIIDGNTEGKVLLM